MMAGDVAAFFSINERRTYMMAAITETLTGSFGDRLIMAPQP
jgi:hypothetical protein